MVENSSDWVGNSLWCLGRRRKCCPRGLDSSLGRTTIFFLSFFYFWSLISVLLRFLMFFRNLTSVLDGWLDALQGLLGFYPLLCWDFAFGFDDIPHSFSLAGPRVRCTDAQDTQAPFHNLVPLGLYLSQIHKHIHLHIHIETQVLQIPQWTSFFQYLLFTVWQNCII